MEMYPHLNVDKQHFPSHNENGSRQPFCSLLCLIIYKPTTVLYLTNLNCTFKRIEILLLVLRV